MNKIKRDPLVQLLGILTVVIILIFFGALYSLFGAIFREGFQKGVESITLSDLCVELEEIGMGTDFVKGYGFKVYECTVITGDWKEDWDIPEEYDIEETDEGVIIKLGQGEVLLENLEFGESEDSNPECVQEECPECIQEGCDCWYDVVCVAMGHCPVCPKTYISELVETQVLLQNCQTREQLRYE